MNKSLKKLIKLYNITKELRKELDNHKDQHYIENLEKASQKYAHNWFNMHDMNNYKALKQGFEAGSKWQADQDKKEIERLKGEITARVLLIKSEPDGIVRESMFNNLLIDL